MFGRFLQVAMVAAVVAFFFTQAIVRISPAIATHKAGAQGRAAPVKTGAAKGYGEYRIAADSLGQYATEVDVNGARVHVMVDTGATFVALAAQDAKKIGLAPEPSQYTHPVSTANGLAHMARVMLNDVRLGSVLVPNVEAFVAEEGALSTSLLGMSFLRRLSKVELAAGALTLRQ